MPIYTREQAIAEIERELNMRRKVYPGLIHGGKLSRHDANIRYNKLARAIELLKSEAPKKGVQTEMF